MPGLYHVPTRRVEGRRGELNSLAVAVQSLSRVQLFVTPWTAAHHTRPPCPSPTPRGYSNSCPLSWWCHPPISSSVIPFSSCLHSFPASGSFLISQFFASGGQSVGTSASASVLPMNIQDWSPLGLTILISWQSKGLSRVFFSTQFECLSSLLLSLLYGPAITSTPDNWKTIPLTRQTVVGKAMSLL